MKIKWGNVEIMEHGHNYVLSRHHSNCDETVSIRQELISYTVWRRSGDCKSCQVCQTNKS